MAPQIIHLPDGQTFTVTPIFAGIGFKSHELNTHASPAPVGWTVVLNTRDDDDDEAVEEDEEPSSDEDRYYERRRSSIKTRPYRQPTLQRDTLFISSITNPPSSEFKPAPSPTRQIAMMLWITLYWYFHQQEPSPFLETAASKYTPENARPRGEWKINISRKGVLGGKILIPKLERMGLIASANTSVGSSEGTDGWNDMFVSRRMFWQIPARLFLFTLQPMKSVASLPGTPVGSRPHSPVRSEAPRLHFLHNNTLSPSHHHTTSDISGMSTPTTLVPSSSFPLGPFFSTSHLPTYFPPPPLQYIFTNNIRHPLRPKPPRMGEVFYSRFVPSMGKYLSFRVASTAEHPVPYLGPVCYRDSQHNHLLGMSDSALLQSWFSSPRVKKFWGNYEPNFLKNALSSNHSFPAIGLWDGVPFGYFEIYWIKEDILGQKLGHDAGDWDRGLHILIGEEWSRGRIPSWLSSLVHWCFCGDFRTMSVCLEPRIDNERFINRLETNGFSREKQVAFPHKQSWLVRLRRENWEGPSL